METLSFKLVKARKSHICNFCRGPIEKGEEYENSTNISEGSLYPWKNHKHCSELVTKLDMYEPMYDEGVSQERFGEVIYDRYYEVSGEIGKCVPLCVKALYIYRSL